MVSFESFRASDGVRLSYCHLKPPESVNSDVPVYLLHGFASDSEVSWVDPGMVRTLVGSGREMFAVDARGQVTRFVPALIVGVAGYFVAQASGRTRTQSLILGVLVMIVGSTVAAVKNFLVGH